jgi:hypothetical protein
VEAVSVPDLDRLRANCKHYADWAGFYKEVEAALDELSAARKVCEAEEAVMQTKAWDAKFTATQVCQRQDELRIALHEWRRVRGEAK